MASYTIGRTGDYSTAQVWEDASPATLTELYEGRFQGGQFHTHPSAGVICTISGQTTTSSFRMQLTHDNEYHDGNPHHPLAPRLGARRAATAHDGLINYSNYTRYVGLILGGGETFSLNEGIKNLGTGAQTHIYECIIMDCDSWAFYCLHANTLNSMYVKNCLVLFSNALAFCGGAGTAGSTWYMYHVTAMHCNWRMRDPQTTQYPIIRANGSSDATFHLKNTYLDIADNSPLKTSDQVCITSQALTWGESTHNASSDGTANQASGAVLTYEGFEGTGYEDTWRELIGTGPTINEDKATSGVTGAPADWGDQCCEMVAVAGQNCTAVIQRAGSDGWGFAYPTAYVRFDFILDTDSLGNNESNQIWALSNDVSTKIADATVQRDGSGVLQLSFWIQHDGSGGTRYTMNISQDTRYRVECKIDSVADTWEWKVDGTSKNSGSLTGSGASMVVEEVWFGGASGATDAAMTIYFDNIWARNDQYPFGTDIDVWRTNVTRDVTTEPTVITVGEDGAKDYAPATPQDCYWDAGDADTNKNGSGLRMGAPAAGDQWWGMRWGMDNLPAHLYHLYETGIATWYDLGDAAARTKIAQPFTPPITGAAKGVAVRIQRTGAPSNGTDNIRISLESDSSGDPSGTTVGSAVDIAWSALGTSFTTIWLDVNSPSLTGSSQYWLVLERTGSVNLSYYYQVEMLDTDPSGKFKIYNGSSWSEHSASSLMFAVDTPSAIRAAQLLVKPESGDGSGVERLRVFAWPVTNPTWVESTVTWNTGRPTAGAALAAFYGWFMSTSGVNDPYPLSFGDLLFKSMIGSSDQEFSIYVEDQQAGTTYGQAYDSENATAANRPYLNLWTGFPDYGLPASQTDLYQWGADLSADSDLAVTTDIRGNPRYWNSCGAFDGPPPSFGEVAETASFRSAVEFQIAYPTSDQNEVGTWTHATTATLYEAVDDVLGVDDADVIDSP
jgi:hypothetical protein